MSQTYTAAIQQSNEWWIGWVQETRGVNCQEQTRAELLDSLKSAVEDMLEVNRAENFRGGPDAVGMQVAFGRVRRKTASTGLGYSAHNSFLKLTPMDR